MRAPQHLCVTGLLIGEGEEPGCEGVDTIKYVRTQVRRDMVVTAIQQEVLDLIRQAVVHRHRVSADGDLYPCVGTAIYS